MGLVSDQIDVILTGYFYQLLQTISLFLDLFSCEIFFFFPQAYLPQKLQGPDHLSALKTNGSKFGVLFSKWYQKDLE